MELLWNGWTLVLAFFTILLATFYLVSRRTDRYPPGPTRLPIIGNVHQILLAGTIMDFCELNRKKYGDVFTVHIGSLKRVVLSGYDNFHNVLIKNADYSSTRCPQAIHSMLAEQASQMPGLFWAPSPHWKKMRMFAISTLRQEGMGKAAMELKIITELEHFIEDCVTPNIGLPISVLSHLKLATHNLISQMIFGVRYEYDDKEAKVITDTVAEVLSLTATLSLITNMPIPELLRRRYVNRHDHLVDDVIGPLFSEKISEHRRTLDSNNPRDVVDRFLLHSQTLSDEERLFFNEANLKSFCGQLYSAGYESTANVLSWALLFICLHPEHQQKVRREIDDVIGSERWVTSKDRLAMPFTDAVLLETIRRANIAPIAAPHTLLKEMVIDGKIIPAGADILLNMTSVLYDEQIFEEADKFKPERYLTGNVALKKQRTIPFSLGRRACVGESLAKMEIFIFFVTLLQRYTIRLADDSVATDKPMSNGQGNFPPPHQLVFTARD